MKIEFNISRRDNLTSLIVNGDLIAQNGTSFKGELQKLQDVQGDLELSLKNAESIDVSAIQLIRSFRLLVQASHHKLKVILPESESVISLLSTTGLLQILQSENLKNNTKQ